MPGYSIYSGEPLRLRGCVQRYSWGKVGGASRIAGFIKDDGVSGPLAEYWLGTHVKGMASAVLPDGSSVPLIEILRDEAPLRFMLKVLSINPTFGLSIQSHPDAELARRLHADDPRNYPDPNPKPEVGIAISTVKLLYNIKTPGDLRRVFKEHPELLALLSDSLRGSIDGLSGLNATEIRKRIFIECMMASEGSVRSVVTSILKRYEASERPVLFEEIEIFKRLATTYGSADVGLVMILIMNLISLSPGEAIFIGPNTPHAYLDGDLVECMVSSDNVIRAGLTTKYRDVTTLVETTDYDRVDPPSLVRKARISAGHSEFILPTSAFSLEVLEAGINQVVIDQSKGHGLAFCLGKSATIVYGSLGESMILEDGAAVFLPQSSLPLRVTTGAAQVFIAR